MSESNGITVTGSGTASVAPDTATVSLGVSVLAPTAAEAASSAARSAEYEWTDSGRRDLGYRAQNSVVATVRDISTVGQVIDAAVAAAGDAVTVEGLDFTVGDTTGALTRAREAAWEDVMERARHLAALAGVSLGRPVEIEESEGRMAPPAPKALRMEAASTPVEAGTLEVTTTIRARFRID
jgi:uncharacterized protein YggE